MKCDIPGAHMKVFGRAIHSLSKIGDELYFEPLDYGLALRTVNMSRSAYACFTFAPSFFSYYNDGQPPRTGGWDAEPEVIKCKIGMKSCLSVFRSLASLEKTVEKCSVSLNMDACRLVFQMHCRHGIVKTHNLAFIECETLQAVFSKTLVPNVLSAHSKVLSEAVMNFQTTQEEVSLFVTPEKVAFKNYIEDEPDPKKVVHTELLLLPAEFENFQVGVDTDVTFCLKEFRAIIGFAEAINLPVSMHFEGPGKPIICSVESSINFEANFVLATLAEAVSQASQTSQLQASQMNHSLQPQTNTQSQFTRPSTSESIRSKTVRKNPAKTNVDSHATGSSNAFSRLHDIPSSVDKPEMTRQHGEGDQIDQAQHRPPPADTAGSGADWSPTIPVLNKPRPTEESEEGSREASDEEAVPGTPPRTPPRKKFKSLFFGLSQSTASGSQPPTSKAPPVYQVLAEASDDDD